MYKIKRQSPSNLVKKPVFTYWTSVSNKLQPNLPLAPHFCCIHISYEIHSPILQSNRLWLPFSKSGSRANPLHSSNSNRWSALSRSICMVWSQFDCADPGTWLHFIIDVATWRQTGTQVRAMLSGRYGLVFLFGVRKLLFCSVCCYGQRSGNLDFLGATVLLNFGNSVLRRFANWCLSEETLSRRFLLSGVYDRWSTRSHQSALEMCNLS